MTSPTLYEPLAARMRPKTLEDFVGQSHLLAPGKTLRQAIDSNHMHSMIFWGPPGTGKTTLAEIIASTMDAHIESLSAVLAGVKDIRAAVATAQKIQQGENKQTILFVDEVHRFNKAQQDAFLPYLEDGTVFLIGATTENPSFELNNALLSRARVYVLKSLTSDDIKRIINHALQDKKHGIGSSALSLSDSQLDQLTIAADGDGRKALNSIEILSDLADEDGIVSDAMVNEAMQSGLRRFDKGGDVFYEQISALHKSVRGSNPDASLYWFSRMVDGGCDPRYIARRVLRMASEDIGNADPRGLTIALDAWQTYERLGSPEGELAIAQAIAYLAVAPKSNALYVANKLAMQDAKASGSLDVPLHLRNAPTKLMRSLDYGKDYRYAHDEPDAFAKGERYFPESLGEKIYYHPVERGLEIKIKDKLDKLRQTDG